MKITLGRFEGDEYPPVLDSDVSNVTITEAFNGPTFVSLTGDKLVVQERDGGWEVAYLLHGRFRKIETRYTGGTFQVVNPDLDRPILRNASDEELLAEIKYRFGKKD